MIDQPYVYRRRELVEPDWTPLPGLGRRHRGRLGVRPVAAGALREERRASSASVLGDLRRRALLRRPGARPGRAGHHVHAGAAADAEHDGADGGRVRPRLVHRRVLRRPGPPLHDPGASATGGPTGPRTRTRSRDSLHEHDMWAVEGLTHRYPTKVLAELLPTCPQYCGHCTRMDLVGNSDADGRQAQVRLCKPVDRLGRMIDLPARARPGVRDVVVSGGDVANMPWPRLEEFLDRAARDRQRSATSGWPPRR